jgi:glycosyltransferase involved in cell wall biosynthesis
VKNEFPAVEFRLLGFSHAGNPTSVPEELVRDWERAGLVRYLGFTDDVMQHYAQADCVVLPSYREGCPRSLLEAASMGKPIITTDVPGCRQVVDDGVTGFLVEVRNAVDLARQMKRMLSLSQDQRRQMGLRGREKMLREFDERTVIDAYLEAIRNVGTAATAAR